MSKAKLPQIPVSKYFQEVILELKKVSWPSKQATFEMTVLVITVSTIVALYLGGIDYLFTQLMSLLIN